MREGFFDGFVVVGGPTPVSAGETIGLQVTILLWLCAQLGNVSQQFVGLPNHLALPALTIVEANALRSFDHSCTGYINTRYSTQQYSHFHVFCILRLTTVLKVQVC